MTTSDIPHWKIKMQLITGVTGFIIVLSFASLTKLLFIASKIQIKFNYFDNLRKMKVLKLLLKIKSRKKYLSGNLCSG